jgi:hypothetical protein
VTLKVKPPRGATVMVARANAHPGINQISWNRRLHGHRAKRGRYRLTITATSNGRHTTSTLTVLLR